MRKKLILGVIAAALAVPASAFAIHDPNVPAGVCAHSEAAVGIPSITAGAVSEHRDLSFSNGVLDEHNNAVAQCKVPV
jgi:hypothetical protein